MGLQSRFLWAFCYLCFEATMEQRRTLGCHYCGLGQFYAFKSDDKDVGKGIDENVFHKALAELL